MYPEQLVAAVIHRQRLDEAAQARLVAAARDSQPAEKRRHTVTPRSVRVSAWPLGLLRRVRAQDPA